MPQPAKVLEPADVRRLLKRISLSRHPARDRVIILLSFKAGLRACEIAGLTWNMVLRANGRLDDQLSIARSIAKMGSARSVPMHPDLVIALAALHAGQGTPRDGPIVRSERGSHMRAGSIVNWFARLYQELELDGCSSHSGRRTFITRAARSLARTGNGSLRDIQELAGHRSLATTELYIQGSRDAQRKLVRLI